MTNVEANNINSDYITSTDISSSNITHNLRLSIVLM